MQGAPVVQEWEAFKSANQIESGPQERVPESVLRSILSRHYGIMPKDVDWEQIRQAGADLCRHYGSILVIPVGLETNDAPKAAPDSNAAAQFWREREDEFSKHDTSRNHELSAVWHSADGNWTFRSGSGAGAPSSAPDTEHIFKSLAREAAKGLAGSRSAEPWVDWLDALRRMADRSTGKLLYSKVSTTGSLTIGERELERMAKSGEPVLPGGLIEFVSRPEREGDAHQPKELGIAPEIGTIEKRMVWDTTTVAIEHLFATSANFCLELRSLAPRGRERAVSCELKPNAREMAEPISGGKQNLQLNTWGDVEISFFNEHSVQITVRQAKSVKEFGEVGMAHKRSGKPTRAWQMLHTLAAANGVINRPGTKNSDWKTVEKRMQELRAWLRERFGLSSNPLPFVKGTGYRANFRIKVAPSYRK